jgi:uncharacterized UBP type Zn finger protein
MKLEKTDKTMGEMEVGLNMSYDWSRIMDGQEELELLHGPGYVGLRNIGSSCYMNSVLQTVLSLPEVSTHLPPPPLYLLSFPFRRAVRSKSDISATTRR